MAATQASHPLATVRIEVVFGGGHGTEYFDVYKRYRITQPIGMGGYGCVVEAQDLLTLDEEDEPVLVAIKKLPGIFRHPDLTKSALREIATLQHFHHDNILHIRDIIIPLEASGELSTTFADVYVVVDRMDMDLAELLESETEIQPVQRRFFCYQILRGIKCIHSANILHRDLKPANLLVNEECDLKIADFGLARTTAPDNKPDPSKTSKAEEEEDEMTTNVQTQWYRAPELLIEALGGNRKAKYSAAVDIWSCGCILAELMLSEALFQGKPGNLRQLNAIFRKIGTPDLSGSLPPHMHVERHAAVPWDVIFPPDKFDKEEVDLVSRMLQFRPEDRITVLDALVHNYLNDFHDDDDEPDAESPFVFHCAYETTPKIAMLREFARFHPEFKEQIDQLAEAARKELAQKAEAKAAAATQAQQAADGQDGQASSNSNGAAQTTNNEAT